MFLMFKYQASIASLIQDFNFTPFDFLRIPNWSPRDRLSLHVALRVTALKYTWSYPFPDKNIRVDSFPLQTPVLGHPCSSQGPAIYRLSFLPPASLLHDYVSLFTENHSPFNTRAIFFNSFIIFHQCSLPRAFLLQPILLVHRSYPPFTTKLKCPLLCEALLALVDRICDLFGLS